MADRAWFATAAKGSGITMRWSFQLWEFRDGLAVRARHFLDRAEALQSQGRGK